MTTSISMTIGGREVKSDNEFPVSNPATGHVIARAPDCTQEQLDEAMSAAQLAFRDWRADSDKRRELLLDCAREIRRNDGELATLLTTEQGKPLRDSMAEVGSFAHHFEYYAEMRPAREVLVDDGITYAEVERRPLGVVATITPWNFPLGLASWKIAPALSAGNTVVSKPSPYTPLSTLRAGEILGRVLPPGVFNVVSGGDELGRWITTHPVPRKVSFTGSIATGIQVAMAGAKDLKRVTLELGGNDAAIVLDDANPSEIAESLFWGAFANNGQFCMAIKRLYVHESIHDEMVDLLSHYAATIKIGNGLDETTQLGPVNNAPQLQRVQELVGRAVEAGAVITEGGERVEPGYFYRPTIVSGAQTGMPLVDEEQFGPALPIIAYRDVEDAVEQANRTEYGLCGSVWSSDPDRGWQVASQLECGLSWVNTHLPIPEGAPFGGVKHSGQGRENGVWGFEAMTEQRVLHRTR